MKIIMGDLEFVIDEDKYEFRKAIMIQSCSLKLRNFNKQAEPMIRYYLANKNAKFVIVDTSDNATSFKKISGFSIKLVNREHILISDELLEFFNFEIIKNNTFDIVLFFRDEPIYESNFSRREKIRSFE